MGFLFFDVRSVAAVLELRRRYWIFRSEAERSRSMVVDDGDYQGDVSDGRRRHQRRWRRRAGDVYVAQRVGLHPGRHGVACFSASCRYVPRICEIDRLLYLSAIVVQEYNHEAENSTSGTYMETGPISMQRGCKPDDV